MVTPNVNKSLSDIFDVELTKTDKSLDELKINAKVDSIDSLETQRTYVKNNIIELIEKGKIMLENMSSIANSTEAAKDFDIAGKLLQTLVDTNMTLLECEVVHKKPEVPTQQLTQENSVGQITNHNTVFVGTTDELSQYLKNNKDILSGN